MKKPIGIIGGLGKIASEYYENIFHQNDFKYCGNTIDWNIVMKGINGYRSWGNIIKDSVEELKRNDIKKATIYCFTLHKIGEQIIEKSGIEFRDALEILENHLKGIVEKDIGIIGTGYAQRIFSEIIIKSGKRPIQCKNIDKIIFEKLAWIKHNENDIKMFKDIIEDLRMNGAKMFLVGCTDLSGICQEIIPKECLIDLPALHAYGIIEQGNIS